MLTCKILILFLRRKNSTMGAKYLLFFVRPQISREGSLEEEPAALHGTRFLGTTVAPLSIALFLPQAIRRNK